MKTLTLWLVGAGCLMLAPWCAHAQAPATPASEPAVVAAEPTVAILDALKKAVPQATVDQSLKTTKGNVERFRIRFSVGDHTGMANLTEINSRVVGLIEQEISEKDLPAAAVEAFRKQVRDGNIAQPMKVITVRGDTTTITYQWRTGGYSGWEVDPESRKFNDGATRVVASEDGAKLELLSPLDLIFPPNQPPVEPVRNLKPRPDKVKPDRPLKPAKIR